MDVVSKVRADTDADADAILDLYVLVDLADMGEVDTSIELIRSALASDAAGAVIEDPAGGLLGHAWLDYEAGHGKTWGDVVVRPGADPAVAEALFDWLLAKAREIGPGLPTHAFARSTHLAKQRMYEAAGGTIVRRFYRMAVALADAPPPVVPALGPGVEIHGVASETDLRTMHAVLDTAFMDHFAHEPESYEKWLQFSADGVASDLTLWWLATVDGEPAAGLYGSVSPSGGYVDMLGTLRAHRGKGLGRLLLMTAFAEFHRRGLRKVVLGVDSTSPTGALDLYQSVGMKPEHVGLRYELPPQSP
jgi:mycothiol synthase